jgi:hypothetical protein
MVFTDERRQEVQERLKQESENGKVAAPAIAKALGEVWQGKSEEEKDVYRQKSKDRAEAAAAGTAPAATAYSRARVLPGAHLRTSVMIPCVLLSFTPASLCAVFMRASCILYRNYQTCWQHNPP